MKTRCINIAKTSLILLAWLYSAFSFAQDCPQNNVSVAGFEVTSLTGVPFSSTSPYELGQEVDAQLWINLNTSNSGNAYSTAIFYDIFIGETKVNEGGRLKDCLSNQVNPLFGTRIFVRNITFIWGEPLSIRNILIRWATNSSPTCASITESGGNAQCFSSPSGFEVVLPVIPDIDFSVASCDRTVHFISDVRGGIGSYTYLWAFPGGSTSTLANPSFTFPEISTYTVSLTVTDSIGGSNTIVKDITIPTITITIEAIPTKLGQNTGSITVTASGGTGPYTVTWSSLLFNGSYSGFDPTHTIEGLGDGEYEIFVEDDLGCSNSIIVPISWASFLSYTIENFEIRYSASDHVVELAWNTEKELHPSSFSIERALDASLNFIQIGELDSHGFSERPTQYQYKDNQLPESGGRIYYRIRYEDMPNRISYSAVKSLFIPRKESTSSWTAYPNPIRDNELNLRLTGNITPEPLLIHLISTKGEQVQLTLDQPLAEINLTKHIQTFSKGLIIVHLIQNGHQQSIKVWKK